MRAVSCGALLVFAAASSAAAQEPRLVGRLPDPARTRVDSIIVTARADRLPTEPLVDRALEGAVKGAPPDRIVAAVARLARELEMARTAFGAEATAAELTAGAAALRAGATAANLAQLRAQRRDQPLTVPAGVLADLAAAGVPIDTGLDAVLALADAAADADYVMFRRSVERDIALGASPVAAVSVRLRAVEADLGLSSGGAGGGATRKRKP